MLLTDYTSWIFWGIVLFWISVKLVKCYINNRRPNHRQLRRIMANRLSPNLNRNELIMIRIDRGALFKHIEPPKGECVICLDDYNNDTECCSIKCEHTFHTKCIETWYREKQSCPLCRESII